MFCNSRNISIFGIRRAVLAIAAAVCVPVLLVAAQPENGRLPDDVHPLRYTLHMRVVPAETNFTGAVEIAIDVLRPATSIWLHASRLKINSASLTRGGETTALKASAAPDD